MPGASTPAVEVPERERLLSCACAGGEGRVEVRGPVGVELVDDVGVRVEPVLEGRVRREGAHDPAVAGALDERRADADVARKARGLLGHAPALAEDDAGLVAGGCGDVDLGLGLAIRDEEVQAGRAGLHGLPVLPRQPEADLGVDAETGDGVDLEGLPPEVALPVLEHQRLSSPASLRVPHVVLAEGGEARTAGVRIGDHGLLIGAARLATDGPSHPHSSLSPSPRSGPWGRDAARAWAERKEGVVMAIDTTSSRTRRAVLVGALGGAVALVAGALGRPLVGQAADGDVIHVGDDVRGSRVTRITTSRGHALSGVTSDTEGFGVLGFAAATSGDARGVFGRSDSTEGTGVGGFAAATSGDARGVNGRSDSTEGTGVSGFASATSGHARGVVGRSDSTQGYGVFGFTTAPEGDARGVFGRSDSTEGTGVGGFAAATSGDARGVNGRSDSTEGTGVSGFASATSGHARGVVGRSDSTQGYGVFGFTTAPEGDARGVVGRSDSTEGTGVGGFAAATSGDARGVNGRSDSNEGTGVSGYAAAASGKTFGVVGLAASPKGTGVLGNASADEGQAIGVTGLSASTEGRGVWGFASAASGAPVGVFGESLSDGGTGTLGWSVGEGTGVLGYSGGPRPEVMPRTGVYGVALQKGGRGGVFSGAAAQLRLVPASSPHPTSGKLGDLFLDLEGALWFCKGDTDWKQIA